MELQAGARALVRHLISLGHTRIGLISGPAQASTSQDRVAGYRISLSEAGIALSPELIRSGGYTLEGGRTAMEELLRLPTPPSAVFCANDYMALGALQAAHNQGIEIPAALSVVGFDDIDRASHAQPPLTTVRQSPAALGEIGARTLIERLEEGRQAPKKISLDISLVVRGSTGPPGG